MTDVAQALVAPASRWRRALARLIDLGVLAALIVGCLYVLACLHRDVPLVSNTLIAGVLVFYEVLLAGLMRGRTLGKLLLKTRVSAETETQPLTRVGLYLRLSIRLATRFALLALLAVFLAYEFDFEILVLVVVVESLVCFFHPRRQSLGDLVARTLVINVAPVPTPST